jgi:hypothetical protein
MIVSAASNDSPIKYDLSTLFTITPVDEFSRNDRYSFKDAIISSAQPINAESGFRISCLYWSGKDLLLSKEYKLTTSCQ